MMIVGAAAVVVIVASIILISLTSSIDDMPSRDLDHELAKESETLTQELGVSNIMVASYENIQAISYEFEIPVDWQLQPSDALSGSMVDAIIMEAANGRIYDSAFHDYAEPESLETHLVPTSIQLFTAKSDLTQEEYGNVMFEIASLIGSVAGMDLRLIDSRQDSLGGMSAVTLEYVLVDVTDSGLPTIKMVETTTTIDSMVYSISYMAELDDYDAFLHHYQNAVKTFRFK